MARRLLIQNGCVLTLDPKVGNHREADVLIEDGLIAEVGADLRARDAEVIDAANTIVMPGFVDTHRHTWRSLFRNQGAVADVAAPGADHHQPDDIYAATLIGLLGAAEAGITTVVDWADIRLDGPSLDAALQAHADSGLRSVLAPGLSGHEDDSAAIRKLAAERPAGGATTIAVGSSDIVAGNLDQVGGQWALARQLGLRIHAHAGLADTDHGVVTELGVRGLLRHDVTLIHCSRLTDSDLDAVASSGAVVALTPSAEMAGSLGAPPIQQLLDRKILLGLGIDHEQLAAGDLFAQMRAAISVQHATYFDLKLAGKAGLPNLLTTRELIRYATADGARVAGLADVTGTLAPGKQADLIMMRTDRPNIYPINDPIGAVVWGMDTSNIDSVFVAGRPVMRAGSLVADVDRARRLAAEARSRVLASAGATAGIGGDHR